MIIFYDILILHIRIITSRYFYQFLNFKVQHFVRNEKTTHGNLSTYEEMNKTISDNTLKINFKANREYDNYPSCRATVSNSESFEVHTSEQFNASQTSLEHENYFENTITDDEARSTLKPPSSTFTMIRSLFTSFKRRVMVRYFDHRFLDTCLNIKELYFSIFQYFKKCLTK